MTNLEQVIKILNEAVTQLEDAKTSIEGADLEHEVEADLRFAIEDLLGLLKDQINLREREKNLEDMVVAETAAMEELADERKV